MADAPNWSTEDLIRLHPEVEIVKVDALPEELRSQLSDEESSFLLTNPKSRVNPQLIGSDAAGFLEFFREPQRLSSAVVEFAQQRNQDPQAILDDAYPAFVKWLSKGWLVAASSHELSRKEAEFSVGTRIAHRTVIECLRSLSDTEVYRVESDDGKTEILKRVPAEGGKKTKNILANELRVLVRLNDADFRTAPNVIASDLDRDDPYVLVEDVGRTTLEAHLLQNTNSDNQWGPLALRILDVYAALHGVGVLHGDINAANIIVRGDKSICLIDFGGASVVGEESTIGRVGTPKFFEPEFAKACINQEVPPASTIQGEVYALANLVYGLLTGRAAIPLSLVHEFMLLQIAREPMRPLADVGLRSESIESVLSRGLAKDPSDRYESVNEFREALLAAMDECPMRQIGKNGVRTGAVSVAQRGTVRQLRMFIDHHFDLMTDLGRIESLCASPTISCSVFEGAAGEALAALEIATFKREPIGLLCADLLAELATSGRCPKSRSRHQPSDFSAYQSEPGTVYSRALVDYSFGKLRETVHGIKRFASYISSFLDSDSDLGDRYGLDMSNGPVGMLLAGGRLLSYVGSSLDVETADLENTGDGLCEAVCRELVENRFNPKLGIGKQGFVGLSHGSLGLLYALLDWCVARNTTNSLLDEWVDQLVLAADQSPVKHGVLPVSFISPKDEHLPKRPDAYPGWCHGVAGQALFWAKCAQYSTSNTAMALASRAGEFIIEKASKQNATLCCGLSGQAIALVALGELLGEERYFRAAEDLASYAIVLASDLAPTGLFKGRSGVAVAATAVLSRRVPTLVLV